MIPSCAGSNPASPANFTASFSFVYCWACRSLSHIAISILHRSLPCPPHIKAKILATITLLFIIALTTMKKIFYFLSSALNKPTTLWWALTLGSLLLSLGVFLPMLTISKLIIIRDSFSIITGLIDLLTSGQIIIFLLVAGFSVVLPILKISTLYLLLSEKTSGNRQKKMLKIMHEYGRWAMLDVMIVALLVVTVKLGAIASIQVHSGLYVFGLGALLLMIVTSKVSNLSK